MDEQDVTREMEDTAEEARHEVRDTAGRAREKAHAVRDRVAENARNLSQQAREQVTQGAHQLRERGESLIEGQKGRAADEVSHLGAAIHGMADRLRDEQNETIAHYADSLAGQLDSAADYLRNRDVMSLFHDAQAFARRRPEVVLGGMFVAGLAIARFIKAGASSPSYADESHREADEYGSYSGYTEGTAYRGAGIEADTDFVRNVNAGPAGLAGGLEHVESGDVPTAPGAISGGDITSGTKPGGPSSIQP